MAAASPPPIFLPHAMAGTLQLPQLHAPLHGCGSIFLAPVATVPDKHDPSGLLEAPPLSPGGADGKRPRCGSLACSGALAALPGAVLKRLVAYLRPEDMCSLVCVERALAANTGMVDNFCVRCGFWSLADHPHDGVSCGPAPPQLASPDPHPLIPDAASPTLSMGDLDLGPVALAALPEDPSAPAGASSSKLVLPPPMLLTVTRKCRDSLRVLVLSECPWLVDSVLVAALGGMRWLHTLDLGNCRELTDFSVLAVADNLPRLKHLSLRDLWRVTDWSVCALPTKCPKLEVLVLLGCSNLTDRAMIALSALGPALQSLNVWGCHNLTDAGIGKIIAQCTGVRELNLRYCHLLKNASVALAAHCMPHLRHLNLRYLKGVGDDTLLALAKHQRLESLNIGQCNRLSASAVHALAEGAPSLRELRMRGLHAGLSEGTLTALARKLHLMDNRDCQEMTWHRWVCIVGDHNKQLMQGRKGAANANALPPGGWIFRGQVFLKLQADAKTPYLSGAENMSVKTRELSPQLT